MARYHDDDDKPASISFHKNHLIQKMGELMADYVEMMEDHPEFDEEMCLSWGGLPYSSMKEGNFKANRYAIKIGRVDITYND